MSSFHFFFFFFSSRRRHTRYIGDWSSDVCSSDLMQEIARLDGVPPNMSVRIATPSPLSTRLTASIMSLRQRSASSSAPIVTDSICFCGPITCSSAALNSSARRPWVTSTIPIIEDSSCRLGCTARKGHHVDHPRHRCKGGSTLPALLWRPGDGGGRVNSWAYCGAYM